MILHVERIVSLTEIRCNHSLTAKRCATHAQYFFLFSEQVYQRCYSCRRLCSAAGGQERDVSKWLKQAFQHCLLFASNRTSPNADRHPVFGAEECNDDLRHLGLTEPHREQMQSQKLLPHHPPPIIPLIGPRLLGVAGVCWRWRRSRGHAVRQRKAVRPSTLSSSSCSLSRFINAARVCKRCARAGSVVVPVV